MHGHARLLTVDYLIAKKWSGQNPDQLNRFCHPACGHDTRLEENMLPNMCYLLQL